nr:ABC transporter permease [Sedimentibacter acidaminivorans]
MPTSGFGIGIVSCTDIVAFPEAVTVYSAYFEDRKNINEQTAKLHGLLSEKGYSLSEWLDADNNKRVSMPWSNINSMQAMSLPVSTAFFLLSCIIVGVLIMRIVKSDSVVIGTLYAQGYRRRELTRHYMAIPVLLSAVGGLAGMLLALPCVRPVVDSMLIHYNLPNRGISFSPLNLALAVLMPVAFIGLSSFFIIRKILKRTAVNLMKGDEQKAKVNFIERALRLNRFKFSTKFRIREQVRSIPRLLFLVLGVSAASMILMFGFTFNYSMDVVMEKGALERYMYPLEYNFKEVQNLQDGGIPEGAEPYNAFRCYPKGRQSVEFYLVGMIILFLVTSLMIDESRNTISLFKILGYRRKELVKLILNSSTPAVFIGFWLGLPLMLAFGNNLYGYVAEMINMVIPMIVNPLYVLISFMLIFVVYEIAKRLSERKLKKISMSEALKMGTE